MCSPFNFDCRMPFKFSGINEDNEGLGKDVKDAREGDL
jgi:hypothetical protein